MNPTMKPSLEPHDVSSILNRDVINGHTIVLVALTALAIVFDGADMQLLSVAIPSLMREWDLPRSAFATVMAAGLIGMIIGGAFAGAVGDRAGRKTALLLSVATFGLMTMAMSAVSSVTQLLVLRFVAGIGLGGALPNAAALAAEYVPSRRIAMVVTMTIVCVPIGGMTAGYVASRVLPALGWRWIFVLGGVVPLSCLVLQQWVLAESPRFLSRRPDRWPELVALLNRMGHAVPADCSFTDDSDRHASHASFRGLFSVEFVRDTVSLWIALFSCMLAVYAGFNWIPALLSGVGWSDADASRGILYFNFGGVIGALLAGAAMTRFGSRIPMLLVSLAGVACGLILARMPIGADAPMLPVFVMLTVAGALINAVMVSVYALAAHVYPTEIRTTGIGAALAFGRVGAVLSASAGSAMLDSGGYPRFFAMVSVAMVVCFIGLALIRRHLDPADRASTMNQHDPSR